MVLKRVRRGHGLILWHCECGCPQHWLSAPACAISATFSIAFAAERNEKKGRTYLTKEALLRRSVLESINNVARSLSSQSFDMTFPEFFQEPPIDLTGVVEEADIADHKHHVEPQNNVAAFICTAKASLVWRVSSHAFASRSHCRGAGLSKFSEQDLAGRRPAV